ncbi:hypothetical protein HMPREF1544_03552 [Mucor circinelloides 1006PhL]|uniref:Uncharacterized protein n=1 Tax=Mucor circinelloides f. circinelloides (strain 1006PhL) TaxID=1220926 RepID=S2KBD6_MUCC1|nr:hypothetical protein HMPREF1544_03552 [Mucor circinelloides 1006PhL]KAG1119822.1 hypothetical protein G6F42_012885 [Rhizopus arrhizus]
MEHSMQSQISSCQGVQTLTGASFSSCLKNYYYERADYFSNAFIEQSDNKASANEILLPALDLVLDTASYPTVLNWDNADNNDVGHIIAKMDSDELQSLMLQMRQIVQSLPGSLFRDFFFVLYPHGIKQKVPYSLAPEYPSIVHYGMHHHHVDFNSVFYDQSNPVANSLYVDLAISYKPIQPNGGHLYVTGLWSEFKQVLGVVFCNFSGLGGFKYTEKNHYIKSVQAYGVWKHAFF